MAAILGLVATLAVGGIIVAIGLHIVSLHRSLNKIHDSTKRAFYAAGMTRQALSDLAAHEIVRGEVEGIIVARLNQVEMEIKELI